MLLQLKIRITSSTNLLPLIRRCPACDMLLPAVQTQFGQFPIIWSAVDIKAVEGTLKMFYHSNHALVRLLQGDLLDGRDVERAPTATGRALLPLNRET